MKKIAFLLIAFVCYYTTTAQDVDLVVSKISEKPTIDGIADEIWTDISEQGMGYVTKCEGDNCNPGSNDASMAWKIAWDETNFYLYAIITDDNLNINPNGSSQKKSHKYDCVEVYFDTSGEIKDKQGYADETSRGMSQLRFNYGVDPTFTFMQTYNEGQIEYDENKTLITDLGVESAQLQDGSTGWLLEASIPWETIYLSSPDSITPPEDGKVLAFEIHYGDNDDGSDVESKLMWNNDTGIEYWDNVLGWSLIELDAPVANSSYDIHAQKIICYPNPTNGLLNLSSETTISSYSINTIAGSVIASKNVGSESFEIDMSSYDSGVYLIRLFTESNGTIVKKLVKK